MRPKLREPTLLGVRVATAELLGDGETEHAVPEELQPFVALGPVLRPRGVGEGSTSKLRWKRCDERPELIHAELALVREHEVDRLADRAESSGPRRP